ncbi:hypothetical protein BP5796_02774 [Coleophoma crateriformis]|uniref:Dipeptidyl-peptidase V n=1 Tax=Coleophoma crateriformis TaxID=565419 RepID=A0A3D8SZD4_9HELO|nr:hypothetical protein BP5796_02774 [Coleophoma crateriformis]
MRTAPPASATAPMQAPPLTSALPRKDKKRPMQRDLRSTPLWQKVDALLQEVHDPSIGKISGAHDIASSPDGQQIAFAGTVGIAKWREESAPSRICVLSLLTAPGGEQARHVEVITAGPLTDRLPKWSPDGQMLAFLSDRAQSGIFQLYGLRVGRLGEAVQFSAVENCSVEDFHWSADGSKILIQSAGLAADKSDATGSGHVGGDGSDGLPKWMPSVDDGNLADAWRALWVLYVKEEKLHKLTPKNVNPWEASWCANDQVVMVASDAPGESDWYDATLRIMDLKGQVEVLYSPKSKRQVSLPVVSPGGELIAVIEALCSDRGLAAGGLKVLDVHRNIVREFHFEDMDITQSIWKSDSCLLLVCLRGFETVVEELDIVTGQTITAWTTSDGCGSIYPSLVLLPSGACVTVLQSWAEFPKLVMLKGLTVETLISFSHEGHKKIQSQLGPMTTHTWKAQDGLEIQGQLIMPKTPKKGMGLIVSVHGGPTFCWTNTAPGGFSMVLNSSGYVILRPNPRGSTGRGKAFTEAVLGDMGGLDAQDILSGIESLCTTYPDIDRQKIGVLGGSYGGFMASLLPTLTPIFAASVSLSAVTDWHSFHTTSNIPTFDQLYLDADPYSTAGGRYLSLSPIMAAGKYATPVLQLAGDADLAVPCSQAVQYHRALLERGVESACVIYPGEGHGVGGFPAQLDVLVRSLGWLERFMPG